MLEGGEVQIHAAKLGAHEGVQLIAGRLWEAAAGLPVLGLGLQRQLQAHWTFTKGQPLDLYTEDSHLPLVQLRSSAQAKVSWRILTKQPHSGHAAWSCNQEGELTAKLGAATVM